MSNFYSLCRWDDATGAYCEVPPEARVEVLMEQPEFRRAVAVAEAADMMMAILGCEGEIDTKHRKVQALLARLYDWKPECNSVKAMACTWTQDAEDGSWDTSCGGKFSIEEGSPAENGMHFCCYCGSPVEVNGEGNGLAALSPVPLTDELGMNL